jgi:hexosaminidase
MPVPFSAVIPAPVTLHPDPGADFVLKPSTAIVSGGGSTVQPTVDWLAALLRRGTGFPLPVRSAPEHGSPAIVLELRQSDPALGDEGYSLSVEPDRVLIQAGAAAGLFHGAETLRQLLPPRIEASGGAGPWVVSGGRIVDHPRYPWRGAMLDVARHFFAVADVERYIDEMALYKLNVLHLHLSDDQGWRIAISGWPALASVGGSTAVGGGPGGFYTEEQYRQIVAHAASRYITVVPEIDTPGHVNAALASYAELNCDGIAPAPYTGIEVGFSSLCVQKPVTYRFLDDVIGELAALTPGPYLDIGGDEAKSTPLSEYRTFIETVTRLVAAHGKTPMGWAEIGSAALPLGSVAEYWDTSDGGASLAAAAARGAKLVLAPADRCYLDQKYDPGTPLGLTWAGPTSVETAYGWDPEEYPVPAGQVLGVEAPLFSETLRSMADLEYMAFPRLPGIAEIGWSPRSAHAWAAYRDRLAAQAPRWEALGIHFYAAPGIPWPSS